MLQDNSTCPPPLPCTPTGSSENWGLYDAGAGGISKVGNAADRLLMLVERSIPWIVLFMITEKLYCFAMAFHNLEAESATYANIFGYPLVFCSGTRADDVTPMSGMAAVSVSAPTPSAITPPTHHQSVSTF